MKSFIPNKFLPVFCLAAVMPGCALHPAGEKEEREKLENLGRPYTERPEPPPLPEAPGPEDYLRFAFLNNADLEARYWEWRAAAEQILQDASPPNAAVPFSYMFSGGNMKAWDRTTLGITNDPMTNIPFPTKLATAGRRALEAARAAGRRFEGAKFLLQSQVLSTYYDLALLAESIRIQEENLALLRLINGQAAVRVQSGAAPQQDLLKSQTELDLAGNELANLRSQVPGLTARLNALIGRPASAPVPLPLTLPAPRPLPVSDEELIRLGSERSPELAALAREVAGREEALSLARQAYIPDFGLSFSFTGTVSQAAGAMLVIPLRLEAIRAGIEQARAGIRAARAARVQYERDLAASFVLNLYVLRNDERQIALFDGTIIPRARRTVQIAQTAYAANRVGFVELLDGQRTLLEARLAVAQLKMEREKALAAIETWAAIDVEAMRSTRMALRGIGMRGGSSGKSSPRGPSSSSGEAAAAPVGAMR
ncbi:MAG: TolC family protein [Planctomycetes bacterium]|nr:TolC family protein [Planctomycetota bacterium]